MCRSLVEVMLETFIILRLLFGLRLAPFCRHILINMRHKLLSPPLVMRETAQKAKKQIELLNRVHKYFNFAWLYSVAWLYVCAVVHEESASGIYMTLMSRAPSEYASRRMRNLFLIRFLSCG